MAPNERVGGVQVKLLNRLYRVWRGGALACNTAAGLSSVARSRDVTVYALIVAALLLLVAVAASVRTTARLP